MRMHPFAGSALGFDGNTVLTGVFATQSVPAGVNPAGLELYTGRVNDVVGEQGNEQVSGDAIGLVMVD